MKAMKGFVEFIREQGVVGLAIGFLLGGAVSKVVSALVTDIINPLLSFAIGSTEGLKQAHIALGDAKIMWGDFLSVMIDFLIIAAVIYFGFKGLGLDKLDKKKEK
ncbi:MAG: MscL family protein [Candidatus Moranbacteria bacterium]|nr:MscL family protein [Candidatus Moranbacteria bacterium]